MLLDEWQEVPGVFGARRAVDADPRSNRFYLTGSVRAEHDNEVWPGTGRFVRLAMHPMTVRERIGEAGAKALSGRARRMWLQSYLEDLLTHDVEELEEPVTRRRDKERLRRYFEAYALNSAGTAEHKTIFDAAGVARDTAVAYEHLLTGLLIADRLPAWTSNRLKRLVRTPKRYLIDAALIPAALRLTGQAVLGDGDMLGRMLDTFVVAQLRPETVVAESEPRLHHLRTEAGRHEVDVVVELGGERIIGSFVTGVVLHTGPRLFELSERIVAAPISTLWG